MCVDQFNEYYANVGSNLANAIPPVTEVVVNDEDYQIDSVFQFSPVSLEQLEKSVLELKGGSAPGVDGIHTQCMAISLRSSSDPVDLQLRLHTCGRMNGCTTCECVESVDEYKYLEETVCDYIALLTGAGELTLYLEHGVYKWKHIILSNKINNSWALHFTFHLMQRLKSEAITDFTNGVRSPHRALKITRTEKILVSDKNPENKSFCIPFRLTFTTRRSPTSRYHIGEEDVFTEYGLCWNQFHDCPELRFADICSEAVLSNEAQVSCTVIIPPVHVKES
ncbi:hypothetical protein J6590_048523 [Homalodisca vitripennis]|nr:hypothetical protein J6590_048523 [Homalodisca vitripennis]